MKVISEISVSLDGLITGPNPGPGNGLGDGGEQLHEWVTRLKSWRERHDLEGGETGPEDEMFRELWRNIGAFIMGRGMFDSGEAPWGEEPPFHAPVYVLTHEQRPNLIKKGGTTFIFVTEGPEAALKMASESAGGKDVLISGGGNTIQQFVVSGILDELNIHLIPLLLGRGARLFDEGRDQIRLEIAKVVKSPEVTHLTYRVSPLNRS